MTMNTPVIAVIDDDASMLKALERLLRARGFVAELFASAEDFLHRLSGTPVGCMILDIDLSGMSGIDLRRHLTEAGKAPPVIFITGQADEKNRAIAMHLGCIAYLKKPFAAQSLVEALEAGGISPQGNAKNEGIQRNHDASS